MIPVKLALRNFLSYTEIHDPLVFSGIHVACLSGENGAGKSTLLDAITWALWGESRARTHAQLVHTGRSDMEVELEFELAGTLYRVVRKWTARGRGGAGATVLDLAICDDGVYRSITGNSVPDSEKKIVDLLRMTYETFTNSSFILQNRADTFALATPAQRKTVLAEILELAEYDRLQERAGREVRERELRHRELEGQIREADGELARRSEYAAEGERLTARVAELDEQVKVDEARFQAIRERLASLTSCERELNDLLRQARGTEDEVTRLAKTIAEHEPALDRARAMLAREREIEAGYADLQRARQLADDLTAKLAEYNALCDERNKLDKIVAAARARLESELQNVGGHLARVAADAARLPDYERAVAKAQADQQELARIGARQAEVERALAGYREDHAETRGANDRLKREMHELKDKIDRLEGASICPICQSALDPDGRAALVARYTAEGKAQKAEYQANAARLKQLEGQI
ncbi:MAG: SMC family ATPase, partial [Chloroflexota bacterium]|nr:SMC family ATPase [Chloroflexota bacterium]